MIKEAIGKAVDGFDLTREEMISCMNEIMTGVATQAQIGSFITALRIKGETVEEITGAAIVMREKATKIDISSNSIDTCGTGGSGVDTFNISTTVAFVVSGAGLKVAKHGNRGVSSVCGSADVIKALGVNIDISPEKVKECIEKIGIGFLYAPLFHNAMKFAIGPRREIGIRTIFNILGPLTNPANAMGQVLGVYEEGLTDKLANVLNNLGVKRAFVVHGMDTLDEITITGETKVSELNNKKVKGYYIKPQDFGMKKAELLDIKGGTVEENAAIVKKVIEGEKGPRQDVVLLNASAALIAGGMAKDFKDGIEIASLSIESGKAKEKLEKLVEFTNR
ncbi:MAG: anthranilate phosphoribosyltransferase [Omnitrophica bacterium GWA2_41_15]|nr:MAG: anthranilate phosphoribosyltransferase [Omnitrophica bacterium GWA2_41_15]HAZ10944.1 anthranilate phosphoribosyltransferase [Candidatus Omnitrophota bacterium]